MNRLDSWRKELSTPLNALQDEVNRLVHRYRDYLPAAVVGEEGAAWVPAVDLYETPTEVGIWVDLPGVDAESIQVSVAGRTLTLRGERPAHESRPDETVRFEECPSGPFHRVVELPGEVEVDGAQADAAQGVLHVRFPKVAESKPQTIQVRIS
jgi:HSP20 family protein